MLFNSFTFLIFFSIVFLIYWCIPKYKVRTQNVLLLVSSYIFYGWWDWRFLSLIAFSTLADYFFGLKIRESKNHGKSFLILSLCVNLGLLGFFKYFNFFIESWLSAWKMIGYDMSLSTINIILPVGISFYTFQTMSYSIDVYNQKIQPTRNFIAFATFISFFPQLVAGPIERASNLIPQILQHRTWSHKKFKDGLFQIGIGFFRKVVLADSIGALIDGIYNEPNIHNSSSILMAVILYSFQIYFDFSGYSDIAIGTAKLLGFEFKQNFNLPYFSSSITEFWRRWHISLSSWLKDYLYIPLGGNRKGATLQYRNLFLTMFLGGLWHGSSWNFVVWGVLHGVLLGIERKLKFLPNGYHFLNNVLLFFMVALIWVFFRSLNFTDAFFVFAKLIAFDYKLPFIGNINTFGSVIYGLLFMLGLDCFLFKKNMALESFGSKIGEFQYAGTMVFIIMNIILFYSSASNFIYFQF